MILASELISFNYLVYVISKWHDLIVIFLSSMGRECMSCCHGVSLIFLEKKAVRVDNEREEKTKSVENG